MTFFRKIPAEKSGHLNAEIERDFLQHYQRDDVRKTHEFEGRYENIYLDDTHVPALRTVIAEATQLAEKVLGVTGLRAGYWFNFMPPGAVTVAHRHDDYDELLSGVYYVNVPENAGTLLLHEKKTAARPSETGTIEILPQAGMFVFFKPDVVHEVTKNNSDRNRLSIGMNFGIPQDD